MPRKKKETAPQPPPPPPKTLAERMDDAVIASADNDFRDHLGASVIGKSCDRDIWLGFRWVVRPSFDARMHRLFARGHREEQVLTALVRAAGVTVWDKGPDGKQYRVSAHGNHFGGSMDGIGYGAPESGEKHFLLEYKTSAEKPFEKVTAGGVAGAKEQHYAQMQIYMYMFPLPLAYYIMANKNNDALHREWVQRDEKAGERYYERARDIITSTSPPLRLNDSPGWWECKFCDHYNVCQSGAQVPEINCRTCAHSTPLIDETLAPDEDAVWVCEKHGRRLTPEAARLGCTSHQFHPELLDRLFERVDGATYRNSKGKVFENSEHDVPSIRIQEML